MGEFIGRFKKGNWLLCTVKAKELSKVIISVLNLADEPLETKEIISRVDAKMKGATRTKVLYRLMILRGDGLVFGKSVGSGKGVWIWWI